MRVLIIAISLTILSSGGAFANKDGMLLGERWDIPFERVSIPLEKCIEALKNGKRSITSWQGKDLFWHDGLIWKFRANPYFGGLECSAYKPVWGQAEVD